MKMKKPEPCEQNIKEAAIFPFKRRCKGQLGVKNTTNADLLNKAELHSGNKSKVTHHYLSSPITVLSRHWPRAATHVWGVPWEITVGGWSRCYSYHVTFHVHCCVPRIVTALLCTASPNTLLRHTSYLAFYHSYNSSFVFESICFLWGGRRLKRRECLAV